MKLTKTGYVNEKFITHYTKDSQALLLREELSKLSEDEHLTLNDDNGAEISVAKYGETRYALNLVEVNITGAQSASYVNPEELNIDVIHNCFFLFHTGEMKGISILLNWKPITQVVPISPIPEVVYEPLIKKMESGLYEDEFEYQRFLKIVGVNENQKATDLSYDSNMHAEIYTPSFWDITNYGSHNNKLVCPHCIQLGFIHTKKVNKKSGISGGKASTAILTAGFSLLALGLSKNEKVTQSYCANCKSIW